jgi:hypothetical protein
LLEIILLVDLEVKLVRVFGLNLKEKFLTILEIFCFISAILTLITAILTPLPITFMFNTVFAS